jgi:hypothetical protein
MPACPGQALLALALAAEKKVCAVDKVRLAQARRFYRHRFRHKRHWGQVSWLAQAAAAWWRVDRNPESASLAFEICDWALAYQSEKSGASLNDHQSDTPGSWAGPWGACARASCRARSGWTSFNTRSRRSWQHAPEQHPRR